MIGTFESVRKTVSRYCFIKGADGKSYFCHQGNLKNKNRDWKYVWNGNECTFQIEKNSDPNQKDIAVDVLPVPKLNPNTEKLKQEEINREEKRKRKEHNIIEQIKKKERKDKWDSYCKDHLYYVVMYKNKGSEKDSYKLVNPPTAYKDKLQADENLFFHKAENGDVYSYHLRRVVVYRVSGGYVVKELSHKNKVGEVLYQGVLTVLSKI